MNRFMRALLVVIDGPATVRIREELARACPSCGHHLDTRHEEGACTACACRLDRASPICERRD